MKLLLSAIIAFLFTPLYADVGSETKITDHSALLLCADQADNRIRIINPLADGNQNPTLWCYPALDGKRFKYMPTDAKRVEMDGVVHVLAAYHGRVQLVRFSDQKLIKDYASYSSCHSAELLPDGKIVSANSNHGKLRLHHSADKYVDLDLPYAHGVTWDKQRRCLWALGDFLYRISYVDEKLVIKKKYKLPMSPTGHDLFPLRNDDKMLVSNNDALYLFDVAAEKFEVLSKLKEIKSASQHLDGSIWASDPADMEGSSSWQSNAVIRISPAAPMMRYHIEGAEFYKARWWQRVDFSY